MRLFAGVELAEPVRRHAAAAADALRRHLHRAAPGLTARWVAPENLHITVWFIGEVSEPEADAIGGALGSTPIPQAPFDVSPAGCGAFPPAGTPRVFWIGLRQGQGALTALHAEVGRRLQPLGILPEKRPYSAHLTIARVKDGGRTPARVIREALVAVPAECGACRVPALTLFRSRLSPRGAAYEPLLRVPLQEAS